MEGDVRRLTDEQNTNASACGCRGKGLRPTARMLVSAAWTG
jgi:hypothetical protein